MSDQVNELINSWLDSQILADYNGTVPNKWRVFLEQEGYTFNNLPIHNIDTSETKVILVRSMSVTSSGLMT